MSNSTILVIDDSLINLKLQRLLLSGEGFQVRTATSAVEALKLLETFTPSLILTDVQMPGMDGLEFVRKLRGIPETKGIPVIAISAHAMAGDDLKAMQAGCTAYVTKPVDTRNLPILIRELMDENRRL